MNKLKFKILFLVLFMTIGIAAVSSNLLINGFTQIASNPDDFYVYFSQILNESHPEVDVLTSVNDSTQFSFDAELSYIDHYIGISFYVTNSSKLYDADVSVSCTGGDEYLSVRYEFSDNIVPARETRNGRVEVSLIKQTVSDTLVETITCTLSASAVERTSNGSGAVDAPLERTFYIGDVVTLDTEKFNVVSQTDTHLTLLAQYNLIPYRKQFGYSDYVSFSYSLNSDESTRDLELNVNDIAGDIVNSYAKHIGTVVDDDSVTGSLITLGELSSLGCTVPDDYSYSTDSAYRSCSNSRYKSWLLNDLNWWTRSVLSTDNYKVWYFDSSGVGNVAIFDDSNVAGIRPLIIISKDSLVTKKIFFTLDGTDYWAEYGMTWNDWIGSSYDTSGEFYIENNIVYHLSGYELSGVVKGDDNIISGNYYNYYS